MDSCCADVAAPLARRALRSENAVEVGASSKQPIFATIGYHFGEGQNMIGDKSLKRQAGVQHVEVPIWDARVCGFEPALETNGFTLVDWQSPAVDWHNDTEVKHMFYPEAINLAKALTGARHAFAFEHVVRTEKTNTFTTGYARMAHCDFSDKIRSAAPKIMVKRGLSPAEVEDLDFCIYNLWFPIERPVLQHPLCFLDCTTTSDEDVVDNIHSDRSYKPDARVRPEIRQIKYSDRHRWYYFKDMQVGEAAFFKQMDGREKHFPAAVQCFHCAIEDTSRIHFNYGGRRSVDIRILCCFPKSRKGKL